GNGSVGLPAYVGGAAIYRSTVGGSISHCGSRSVVDVLPCFVAVDSAGHGSLGTLVVHSNGGELSGAVIVGWPGTGPRVHDGGLFQHFAHADRLGPGEYVCDDAVGFVDDLALRLF